MHKLHYYCERSTKYIISFVFVLTTGCLLAFSSGIMLSFPAILNPSILAANSTIHATPDQASWIAASNGFAGVLGFFILSPLFQIVGRKFVNIVVSIILLVGWLIFFYAQSIAGLFTARIVQGIVVGAYYITGITLSEYCDPKRRGYFLSIKKISQAFGSLACHSLVFYFDWRSIAGIAAIPTVLTTVMILFWPESPAFLAMKGRFTECEKSFIWLNGNSAEKLTELKDLINAQAERLEKKKKLPPNFVFVKVFKSLRNKDFLKSFLLVSLLTIAIDASGRYFLLAYLTQMMVEITGDKSVAMYCAVSSDLLLICALCTSCLLIRLFKRRTILLTIGAFAAVLMFIISIALATKTHFGVLKDIRWLIPSIILLHSFVSHVGLVPVAFAISAEVFPLEHKGIGSFTSGIVFTIFYAMSLKLTPMMIEGTGVSGTYAIYGICVTICLALLYILLPETKDKTLQQIEDELKGITRTCESDVLIRDETRKVML